MAILVPFSRVLPYSAGTGSPVSSPVLCIVCMVVQVLKYLHCQSGQVWNGPGAESMHTQELNVVELSVSEVGHRDQEMPVSARERRPVLLADWLHCKELRVGGGGRVPRVGGGGGGSRGGGQPVQGLRPGQASFVI